MSSSEDFCLKWNDHHSIFFSSAEDLCQKDNLTDVTLSCGSKLFSAHKLVLSVCSSYFSSLFARGGFRGQQTVVYLKDVDPRHMELLLSYMYRGEINVQEQELMGLLATAKGLQIKGLTEANDTGSGEDRQTKAKSISSASSNSASAAPSSSSASSGLKRSGIPASPAAVAAAGTSKAKRPSSTASHSDDQPDHKKIKEEVWAGDGSVAEAGTGQFHTEEELEGGGLEDDYGAEGYGLDNTGDGFPIPEGGGPMIYEDNDQNMSSVSRWLRLYLYWKKSKHLIMWHPIRS